MTTRTRRLLNYICINLLFVAMELLWLFYQESWAQYIFLLMYGYTVIGATAGFFSSTVRRRAQKSPNVVPYPIEFLYDMFIISMLSLAKKYFLAVIWIWEMACVINITYYRPEKNTRQSV